MNPTTIEAAGRSTPTHWAARQRALSGFRPGRAGGRGRPVSPNLGAAPSYLPAPSPRIGWAAMWIVAAMANAARRGPLAPQLPW